MGQSFAAGYDYAVPIVSYGVTPQADQRAQSADDDAGKSLTWNISGAVPSAAAIALGALAFATTSDLPQDNRPQQPQARSPGAGPADGAAVRVAIPSIPIQVPVAITEPDKSSPAGAMQSPIVSPRTSAGSAWQPATPTKQALEMTSPAKRSPASQTDQLAPHSRSAEELSPLDLGGSAIQTGPQKQALAKSTQKSPEFANSVVDTVRVEFAMPSPPSNQSNSENLIRRDYSQTLAVSGAERDSELGDEARARLAAATAPPSVSGKASPETVQLVDGELASVKLGEVLKLVETKMSPGDYAALANSSAADSYVGPEMLENAGLQASFDAQNFTLALSAIS